MPFDEKLSVKEQVKRMLDNLPDTVTYEDIQYHLFVREKIERGLQELAEGKFVPEEEMEKLFDQWLSE
jgi:predicted transcriptional regulator